MINDYGIGPRLLRSCALALYPVIHHLFIVFYGTARFYMLILLIIILLANNISSQLLVGAQLCSALNFIKEKNNNNTNNNLLRAMTNTRLTGHPHCSD